MNRFRKLATAGRQLLHRAMPWALSAYFWLLTSPLALAKPKKHVEVVDEGKGYTLPYLFVIAILGLGLMTVLRPSGRRDKAEEKKQDDE